MLGAQQRAERPSHPQVEPEHLLAALLEQAEGIAPEVAAQARPRPARRRRRPRDAALAKLPQAHGGADARPVGRGCAPSSAPPRPRPTQMKDEYVSTEHLLLGDRGRERPRASRRACSRAAA